MFKDNNDNDNDKVNRFNITFFWILETHSVVSGGGGGTLVSLYNANTTFDHR